MILQAKMAAKNDSSHRIIKAINVDVLSGQWMGALEDKKYDAKTKKLFERRMTYKNNKVESAAIAIRGRSTKVFYTKNQTRMKAVV